MEGSSMKNGLYIDNDGTKVWYKNGKLHREDGPAIEWAHGTKEWYLNGKLHREDGPAVEYADGWKWWYLNDEKLTEEEFNRIIEEAEQLPVELKLTDPRWWVRESAQKYKDGALVATEMGE
jgi:hypothetical protein